MHNELVKKNARHYPRGLVSSWKCLGVAAEMIGNDQYIFNAALGSFKGEKIHANDLHRGSGLDVY